MSRACIDCGHIYEESLKVCCPVCGSAFLNQVSVDAPDVFKRKHPYKVSPKHVYRPTKSGLQPEFVKHSPEEFTFIEDYEQSPVIVDYLSFTVKLSDFRHCKKDAPYSGIHFPDEPVFNAHTAKTFEEVEAYNRYFQSVYTEYLEETLRRFIQYVLGFSYGSVRGKGFQFYEDSFVLTSDSGDDYCGQVGIGGNRDTVHFQIPAHGCKYLFSSRSCHFLHHWLSTVLCVKNLARIDLAFDDYDGVHTCEAAERAALLGGFKRSRGFSPKVKIGDEFQYDSSGNKVFTREERDIGSRQSLVYWRIYNKKLERNIKSDNFSWYRSEVELKKYTTDVLLNPIGHFIGLNQYAASIVSTDAKPVVSKSKGRKRVACDVLSASYWAKRQYGRLVNSLLELYEGDFERVVTSLLRDDSVLSYPSMHQKLINSLE